MSELKIKAMKVKDFLKLVPDLGLKQASRGGQSSHWDVEAIVADLLSIGGYSPTEGPIILFQDEIDGTIPGADRAPAEGNRRGCALLKVVEMEKAGKLPKGVEPSEWLIPILTYPAGLSNEEREHIRNRARDLTKVKSQHDYYCWALKLALKNPLMGDAELCRTIGPGPIRSQWEGAVKAGSTFFDPNGKECFKQGLPIDSKDGDAMLINKQGPIQEVTRVRALPGFAREFFLLHPSERNHKSFQSSRNWKQAWDADLKLRPDVVDGNEPVV